MKRVTPVVACLQGPAATLLRFSSYTTCWDTTRHFVGFARPRWTLRGRHSRRHPALAGGEDTSGATRDHAQGRAKTRRPGRAGGRFGMRQPGARLDRRAPRRLLSGVKRGRHARRCVRPASQRLQRRSTRRRPLPIRDSLKVVRRTGGSDPPVAFAATTDRRGATGETGPQAGLRASWGLRRIG